MSDSSIVFSYFDDSILQWVNIYDNNPLCLTKLKINYKDSQNDNWSELDTNNSIAFTFLIYEWIKII